MLIASIQFNLHAFLSSFSTIVPGLRTTVLLAIGAMAGGIALGLPFALMRLYGPRPVRAVAAMWARFWISTPLILQLFWLYYAFPEETGLQISGYLLALTGLSFQISAFLSESFRAGIGSIRIGQWDAAYALGMNRLQALRYVVLRQAVARVLPSLANYWVDLFKSTSIVAVVAVPDMTFRALELSNENFRTMEVFSALALLYLALGFPQTKMCDHLHKRLAVDE